MKNTKCPERKFCINYNDNACEGCAFGDAITKFHKRIERLKKQNETLTIQRNAWALTAKALAPEWISVEERLPEREGYYLTSTIRGVIMIGAFFSYCASTDNPQFKYDVTHWMPLPEAPKMTRKEDEGT